MITNEYINRAIDYILEHSGENISVDEVAAHCNFSRYYFSRMFKLQTGESIYEFIKRVKMEQSAFRLKIEKDRSITDIGGNYGYSSSNYSSAFKQHYDLSPAEFRRNILQKSLTHPFFNVTDLRLETFEECQKKISLEVLPDYFVIFQRHKGTYGNLSVHWAAFQEKYREYVTEQTLFLERTYDDPTITDVNECLYDICMTAPKDCALENTYVMKGGKFAVYHFSGTIDQIFIAYQSVFSAWLPQSGCEIDDRYGFDIYRKIGCDKSMTMEIDFCIPVK